MLALAIATSYPSSNKAASVASVFFIFLVGESPRIMRVITNNALKYNFFVPIGFLGANFLYCAEVAPIKLRVGMASISTANHWLW